MKKSKKGFTLVELLAVITIVSVFMSFLFPLGRKMVFKSQLAKDIHNLRQIALSYLSCAQDTSVNDVTVECIFFNCDSVKQYVFKRIEGRWNLTQLNWKSFQQHPDGNFYAFYKQFANDSIFQGKRIRKSFEFKTYDEVMNEEIMGEVDAEAWWDYSPELPKDMLTNINYGHTSPTSRERHLIITSPSAGMSSTLKFRMIKWQWKLVGLEN
jgi:prepilin-type N-terminal cleavage/methylation domain-containing protein